MDISSGPSVAGLFDRLKERTERLDLLVNTAGVMGETAPIEQVSDESWRRLLAVNLDGAFYCCRETVRWMKETGGGPHRSFFLGGLPDAPPRRRRV